LTHTSCISEAEKYQGHLYQAKDKENKGDAKQKEWLKHVHGTSGSTTDPRLKSLLNRLSAYSNIPRKRKKFDNFCKNSVNVYDTKTLDQLWDLFNTKPAAPPAAPPADEKPAIKEDSENDSDSDGDTKKNETPEKVETPKETETPVETQEPPRFKVPMFPIPNIIQLIIFGFIFITTDTYVIGGHVPLLEIAIMFLIAGALMYLLWARTKSFWPFQKNYNAYEENLDHQFVFYDDFEEEMAALKRKLTKTDKEIRKWNKKTANATKQMRKIDGTIRSRIEELGKQEFEIITLHRKIEDVEVKITDLYALISDREKTLTETKIENGDLREKIYKIQGNVDTWPHEEGDYPRRGYDDDAPTQSVLKWNVEDVYLWWRVALPRGAQRYIELVRECQLTGVDLIGVDAEMLSQFGMMKILIHQVLQQIEHLKDIAMKSEEHGSHYGIGTKARSKSKERKADPSRDSRAFQDGTRRERDRGRSGDYGYEDSRARSNDRRRDERESPPRRSREHRRR